jgi:endonuclease/exonuclease/phosphatase family metal-dependent hydrolase
VFDDEAQDRLVRAWYEQLGAAPSNVSFTETLLSQRSQIPEADRPQRDEDAWIVADTYFVLGPDQKDWDQDGGLLILSRFRILKASGFVFTQSSGWDSYANKGALYARIQIGPNEADYLHLFNTHLQAGEDHSEDRADQLRELAAFITTMTEDDRSPGSSSVGHPILLLGDLNIDGVSGNSEVDKLYAELHGAAMLQDLWTPPSGSQTPVEVLDYGYTTVGNNYRVTSDEIKSRYNTYVAAFWGLRGNVLADDENVPRRYDYAFIGYGSTAFSLERQSAVLIPSPKETREYCLDASTEVLGQIEGELASWLRSGTENPERGLILNTLAGETNQHLATQLMDRFRAWRYNLTDDTMFWRDGDQIEIRVPGMHSSFELDPDPSGSIYTVTQDDEPPTACSFVSTVPICETISRTLSDHLGVSLELIFTYPNDGSATTSTAFAHTSTPPPTQVENQPQVERLAVLLRAIDRRLNAIDAEPADWGIDDPYEIALQGAGDLDAYVELAIQQALRLARSNRFWGQALAAHIGPDDLFGASGSDPLKSLDEKLSDLESAVASLSTVGFTVTGHGVLARLPQPGGDYPTWPPELVAEWDLEDLWMGMLSIDPISDNNRGLITSRHLDHVHPYAWIYRTFLSFDTRSLADAGSVSAAWISMIVEKAYSSDYSVLDAGATKEGQPSFEVVVYAGEWDPVSSEGDGWGMGPGQWLYESGSTFRSWNSCELIAGSMGFDSALNQTRVTLSLDPSAVSLLHFSQFKFQLADEGFPGAPGVHYVLEDTLKLHGDLTQQILLVELE